MKDERPEFYPKQTARTPKKFNFNEMDVLAFTPGFYWLLMIEKNPRLQKRDGCFNLSNKTRREYRAA